jgi:predicted nucleic acid-binding protein
VPAGGPSSSICVIRPSDARQARIVLRKLMLRQQLELATARRSVLELGWLGIEYYPHLPFVDRTFDLAAVMTSYDAMFVVLAEVLGAPLVTCDSKLAGTSGHSARIEVIAA